MIKAEYCKSFGLAMKEAVNRVATWAAYYQTSRRSWYQKPEGGLLLSQVPVMKPLPIVNMSPADCNALRNWASSYGAAVRQRTVRQNLCTTGNARSQISPSPFRVSKGRSLEPWSPGALEPGVRSPKPFSTWSPDKNADSGQMEP